MFADDRMHAALSGVDSDKIDARAGGAFSLFGGEILGTTREIVPHERLVQDWRGKDWPAGHVSRLDLRFSPIHDGRGTHLHLVHAGIPADKADAIAEGWGQYYWLPMAKLPRGAELEHGNTETVVSAFFATLARRDFAAARNLLADDFRFEGPFDTFTAPEPYLAALQKLYPIVKGAQVRKMFVDGGHACVLYDMETNTAAATQLICEWFQVQADKIVSTRAVFDARPFAALFSH